MRALSLLLIVSSAVAAPSQAPSDPYAAAVAMTKSSDATLRRAGADELSRIKNPGAVAVLEGLLGDKVPAVRASAADSLGQLRSRASSAKICALVSFDADPRVRQQAVTALAFLGDPASVPALIAALKDPSVPVRSAAVRTLGVLRAPSAAGPLGELLKDSDAFMRRTAASSLGMLSASAASPALAAALSDADAGVRAEAAKGLGLTGDPSVKPALLRALADPDMSVRLEAAAALGRLGDAGGQDAAIAALKDRDAPVRQKAAGVLAIAGDAEKGWAALDAAFKTEKDAAVKAALDGAKAQLLARLGLKEPPAAVPVKPAPQKPSPKPKTKQAPGRKP